MPLPSNIKELQRFLGFANIYRRFIRNFSLVAAPLTSMLKKGNSGLTWSPAASEAFHNLKQLFTTAPILHHPDPEREFMKLMLLVQALGRSFHSGPAVLPSCTPVLTTPAN